MASKKAKKTATTASSSNDPPKEIPTKKKEKSKASAAKKAALKGTDGKVKKKVRTSTTFRRPKTRRLAREPRYPRKSVPHAPRLDQYKIIRQPLNTESAMKKIEENNTLVFIVDVKSNKRQIKDAAYVRLTTDVDALDIANKIGFI
ncbi:7057_t:CDS:2 [Ambispora gerdemannii]|uniref:7057_t:CDS:1 n=1 Tax=Ambispora gerdemannii TaxID=144530 RepID=A0A9N8W239_9GLOM|nr:7057_t:CDS:2 [Ambispora gerdemannii]